jgi:hypothetical protein
MEFMERKLLILFAVVILIGLGVVNIVGFTWLGGRWLWAQLADYVEPTTPTERKDLANIFVLIGVGIVGALTALAALLNAYLSRKNLRQQRDLADESAQDDALQAYFQQMGELLTEQKLKEAVETDRYNPLGLLARAQTLAVLKRLDARRKGVLLNFVWGASLISPKFPKGRTVLNLFDADLSGAALEGARLREANLSGAMLLDANLSGADLLDAVLSHANLRGANLRDANLRGANLRSADLRSADLTEAEGWTEGQLKVAKSVINATMPNGQKYEDWLKDKEGRKETE